MLLYVGPDQIIPFSGVLGAVIGLILIFWAKVVQFVHKLFAMLSRKRTVEDEPRS